MTRGSPAETLGHSQHLMDIATLEHERDAGTDTS